MKAIIKSVVFGVLGSRPFASRRARSLGRTGRVTILNLHRVAPADGSAYPPLEPQIFRELLRFCSANYEICGLRDLPQKAGADKPVMVLSFDDGYKDFIEYAVPIMREFGLTANQNVIPKCIESGEPPFNVVMQDFIGRAPESLLADISIPGFDMSTVGTDRMVMGHRISHFIKTRPMAEQALLSTALRLQFERDDDFRSTPLMTRAEVISLASDHEIGAHSFEHATMGFESDAYVAEDARLCRDYFDRVLSLPTDIYAFPNGSHSQRQIDLVAEQGFSIPLLLEEDFSGHNTSIHRRFSFHAGTVGEARFKASGGFRNRYPV